MNNIQTKNTQYFNVWSKSYDLSLFQFWMRRFQRPIFSQLDSNKKSKLLDVSCGTGEFLKALTVKKPLLTLYGIDMAEGMLKRAREKLPELVQLSIADVHHLPFKENTFDYVTSTEAFHHYEHQAKALSEMKRVTKRGGKVMVVDVNFLFGGIHWLFKKLEPGCVKINNKKEMKQLFEKAGLKNIFQRRNFMFAVMAIGEK